MKLSHECRYCHVRFNLTKDHIIPKVQGGKNTKRNYQTLCSDCNTRKGGMSDNQVAKLFRWFKRIETSRHTPLNW